MCRLTRLGPVSAGRSRSAGRGGPLPSDAPTIIGAEPRRGGESTREKTTERGIVALPRAGGGPVRTIGGGRTVGPLGRPTAGKTEEEKAA
jgi:hypothetical protein